MQKITRPFFTYLARRKRRKDMKQKLRDEQRLWQQLLAEKMAERQAMTAETEHRVPAIKVAERPVTPSPAEYCLLHPTPSLSGPLVRTDPLARVPVKMLPNPMFVEHQRVLTMFRTHVEAFWHLYGYLPAGIRVSTQTARIMWILNFDYYAWHGHAIPLVVDFLSEQLTDEQVECLHRQGDNGHLSGGMRQAPATRQLRLTEIQEQQIQAMR